MDGRKRFELFDLIYNFSTTATTVVIPFYLLDKGLSLEEVGIVFTILYIAIPLFRILAGYLVDIGKGDLLFPLASLGGAVSSLLYLVGSFTAISLGQIIKGLSTAFFWGSQRVMALKIGGRGFLALIAAVTMFAYSVGYFLSAVLLYLGSYSFVFLMNAILFLLAFFISLSIKSPKVKRHVGISRALRLKRDWSFFKNASVNGLLRASVLVITTITLPALLSNVEPWEGVIFIGLLYALLSIGIQIGKKSDDSFYKISLLLSILLTFLAERVGTLFLYPILFFLLGVVVEREEMRVIKHLHKTTPALDMALYWIPAYAFASLLSILTPQIAVLPFVGLVIALLYHLLK